MNAFYVSINKNLYPWGNFESVKASECLATDFGGEISRNFEKTKSEYLDIRDIWKIFGKILKDLICCYGRYGIIISYYTEYLNLKNK